METLLPFLTARDCRRHQRQSQTQLHPEDIQHRTMVAGIKKMRSPGLPMSKKQQHCAVSQPCSPQRGHLQHLARCALRPYPGSCASTCCWKCFFGIFLPATFTSDSKNKHHVSYIMVYVLTDLPCCTPRAAKPSPATPALFCTPPELSWFGTEGIFSGLGKIVPSFHAIVKTLVRAVWEARCG